MSTVRLLQTPPLSALQQALLDNFQHGLPLSPSPYAEMAAHLGVTEKEVLAALETLVENKAVSRVGPVFKPHRIGTSTLAAMAVPADELLEIVDVIDALPEVNHNYEREHFFNLWFVLTATDAGHLQNVIDHIERVTGLEVMPLPMLEEFYIDLGFPLDHNHSINCHAESKAKHLKPCPA